MKSKIIPDMQGDVMIGHESKNKTRERLILSYWWPGMETEIDIFIKRCDKCQKTRKEKRGSTTFASLLPQCSEPNQRIHMDLFGPLKTVLSGEKFIFCVIDAFSRYTELVAIPDKSTATVASALFSRWLFRHGLPLEMVFDNGKEFCNEIVDTLHKSMKIKKSNTTPYHPQAPIHKQKCVT
jgi:hypothetical protein